MASEDPGSTVSLVGEGSFLNKPSPLMVGCTGKKSSTFTSPPDGLCPLCKAKGQNNVLKTYRINFTQTILLCSEPQCIYPLGSTPFDNLITNTEDLRTPSTSKQKKRDCSELSPASSSQSNDVKRLKSDLPSLGQCSPTHTATSAEAEASTSMHIDSPWETDTSPSRNSLCSWSEEVEVPNESIAGTSNSTPILNSKQCSPLPPPDSHHCSTNLFSTGQNEHCEDHMQSEDVHVVDMLCSISAGNKSSNRLPERKVLEESEDEELRNLEPYPVAEITNSLNMVYEKGTTDYRTPRNTLFSPNTAPYCKDVLSGVLREDHLGLEIQNKSPQDGSISFCSKEQDVPISGGFARDRESAKSCDFLQNTSQKSCDFLQNTSQNLCESKSQAQQCKVVLQHNVADSSCTEDLLHRDLSTSCDLNEDHNSSPFESTVFSVPEQDNESVEVSNKTSLKPVCPPNAEASVEETTSYSLHDTTCLSDNDFEDVCEVPSAITSVMKDGSVESLTSAPLNVCHMFASLRLAENTEKIETSSLSCTVEDNQSALALEKDSTLNLPGMSCTTDVTAGGSSLSPKEVHSSDEDAGLVSCQKMAETVVQSFVQNILPECKSQEKSSSEVLPSLSITTEKNSPIVPEQQGPAYECLQVCNKITPQESAQVTEPDCPFIVFPNTVSEKDNRSTEQEIASLPINPVSGAKIETHDSTESCKESNIQDLFTDHSVLNVADPSNDILCVMNTREDAKQCDLVPDNQMEKVESSVNEAASSLFKMISEIETSDHDKHPDPLLENQIENVKYSDLSDTDLPHNMSNMDTSASAKIPTFLSDNQMENVKSSVIDVASAPCNIMPVVETSDDENLGTKLDKQTENGKYYVLNEAGSSCNIMSDTSDGAKSPASMMDNQMENVADSSCSITLAMETSDNANILPSLSDNHVKSTKRSVFDVADSSCKVTSAMDTSDDKVPAPLPDNQMENNESTQTPCPPEVVENKVCPLQDSITSVEDTLLSESSESEWGNKKTYFEKTVLPDLLLDIQPEHRMEEQLSEVPSPACDADLMVTIRADCKQLEEVNLLQAKLDKLCSQEAEKKKMDITDPDVNNTLQSSINLSDTLSSENAMIDESIDSATDLSMTSMEQCPSDGVQKVRTYQSSQRVLQWKNRKSMCWLDCILSAMVYSKTIGGLVEKCEDNKDSIIVNLFAKYSEATELCKGTKNHRAGRPTKAEACLNEVRMHIFDKLQPLLKCELGQNESPVFAFPLLLKMDPEFQKLFLHSFTWRFKCESCGFTYQDRCQKTMTTFTKIVKDWRPLSAAHRSPCNKCEAVDQTREMHLETLPSLFMLHFVEGLPSNDLKEFAFQFGEHWYEIKTVVRYRDQHFSTWMANDDDTWLESDGLKGSFCRRHHKFKVRAEDIHIAIWERGNKKTKSKNRTSIPPKICPSDTSTESILNSPEAEVCLPQAVTSILSDPSTEQPSHLNPVVETCPAASPPDVPVSKSVIKNISNPLAGMEGYADDDIITLTLVEIPLDSTGQPTNSQPPKTGDTLAEASPGIDIQPIPVEVQTDSAKLPQHTDPGEMTHLPSKPPASEVASIPVFANQLTPIQPYRLRNKLLSLPEAAAATSTPKLNTFSTKKSMVDNVMDTSVKKKNLFISSSTGSADKKTMPHKTWQPVNLLKETDLNGVPKKAENFDGFRARSISQTNGSERSNVFLSKLLPNAPSYNIPKAKTALPEKTFVAPAALSQTKPGKIGFSKLLAKDGASGGEDNVKKLRMKLLKKLKAKKNELAMLEKMSKTQPNDTGAGKSDGILPGGVNRRKHLRDFWQEIQDQIDNESVGTVSSCTSICSSPGDAEFFAELFSPQPVESPKSDSTFLEMLADGHGISADASQTTSGFGYPANNTTQQSTSGSDFFSTSLNQSSSVEESLNLMSSSTLAVLDEEAGYLDSFVDMF